MYRIVLIKLLLALSVLSVWAQTLPNLNTAANFTVLAGTSIISTGNTVIYNNVGIYPGNTLTGFQPTGAGVINGSRQLGNATAQTAQADLTAAYNSIAAQAPTVVLTGQNLGGKTLTSGVYRFNGNADLTGDLTVDASGNPNAVFIFQITGDFTTGAASKVIMRQGTRSPNIFWQIAGNATIGAGTDFKGTVITNQNITMGTQALLQGRLLSRNGTVILDNNPLTIPPPFFSSDISILKTASAGPFAVGSTVTYKIVVKNLGPADETNLLISDLLPVELAYVSSKTSNGVPYNPATGFWSIDNLMNGASDTLTIVATILSADPAKLYRVSNLALVNGDGIDPNTNNNSSTATICVAPPKPSAIAGPSIICTGTTSSTYSVSPISGATYTWSVPSGWIITSGIGTNTITLMAPPLDTASAVISVIATNTCGASEASIKKISLVPPPPANLPPVFGNPFPCQSSTGNVYSIPPQLAVSSASGYTWTVPAGWTISSGQGSNVITVTAGTVGGIISVVAANACGTSNPKTLNVTPVPSAPAALGAITPPFAGNPCAGQVSLTYSVAAGTNVTAYNWTVPAGWIITSGQGTTTITVTAGSTSGNISVVASNGCGNSPASILPVNPATAPPLSAGPITGEHIPCIGQTSVTYSVPTQNGTYNWTVPNGWTILTGQGTNIITVNVGTAPGSVRVTISNGCGTSSASTAPVTPATTAPPTPGSITSNSLGSPCVGQANITYTVVPFSSASSYTWTVPTGWVITGGQGTSSITVTAGNNPGTISVVAKNGCGTSSASTLALTPISTPPPATGPIVGDSIPCVGSTSVRYTTSAGNAIFTWSVPAGWTITSGQFGPSIEVTVGNTSGNITVTASNNCGNGTTSILPVKPATAVPPAPGVITGTGTTNICINQTNITYSISPVANSSGYSWTVPNGWTITSGQGTTSITVNVGTTGGNVAVSATNGCGAGTASTVAITPTTTPPAAPGAISGNTVPCTGQSNVTYSIASVTGISNYSWSVPTGWTITAGQGTTSITVTTSGSAGNVSVSAINACGAGATSSLAVTPTTTAAPAAGAITGETIPCISQTNVNYSISAVTGASSYTWTVPAGWTITNGQGTTNIDVTAGALAGNITVTAANGCGTGVASTLAVKPAFTQPVAPAKIIGNSVPCSTGGNQTYQINPLTNASSYTWTVPTGWTIVSGQGTELITVSPGTNAGVISVTATNGCGTGPASSLNVMVTTVTPPTPGAITVSASGSPCAGQQNVTYTIDDVIGASSYNWVVPAGWVITSGQGTKEITVTVGSNAGQVSVTAVNGCGSGSASSVFTTPTASTPVTSGIIAGSIAPCTGNVATTYSTTATGATSFTWSVPAGWTINTGQGTNQITVTPGTNAGNISVTASNGCGASIPSLLAVVPTSTVPPVAGAISGNLNVCSNEKNLKYSVLAVTGASSYTWSVPAGWTIISGQGSVEIEVEAGTTGGDITVTPENACGAGTPTNITAVIRPSLVLTGTIKDESSPCTGLKYSVTPIAGATTYAWTLPAGWEITSGAGTTTITVKANSELGTVSVSAENLSCKSDPISASVEAKAANVDLDIPNAFSPNGDEMNDIWIVKNLENYPDNDLTIINRWGNEVYRQKSYRNTWNGSGLSAGTYYYILRVKLCNNEEKTLKGFIMIATE